MAMASKKNDSSQQVLDRLPLLLACGENLIPAMSPVSLTQDSDLASSLAMFKTRVLTSMASIPKHSLIYCSVSVLHHVTSLLGEDYDITGHYGNCFSYLDLSITSLQCLPRGSMYRCVEYMAKARDSVRHRKRNMNNNVLDLDLIKRMNFLNRVDQLDQAMVALREMLLITIVRQHRTSRQHKMDSFTRMPCLAATSSVDTSSECDDDSGPIPSLELDFNIFPRRIRHPAGPSNGPPMPADPEKEVTGVVLVDPEVETEEGLVDPEKEVAGRGLVDSDSDPESGSDHDSDSDHEIEVAGGGSSSVSPDQEDS